MPIETMTLFGAESWLICFGFTPEAISDIMVKMWARWPSGR